MSGRLKFIIVFSLGILTGVFIISQLAFRENDKKGKEEKKGQYAPPPQMYLPEVPDEMSFAGEKVPLDRWDVREAFDRELIYNYNNPGHISYILKLSKRYFPIIEARLKENGVPDDFKYLCVAESNLQNLTSRVGAVGYWQFMHRHRERFSKNYRMAQMVRGLDRLSDLDALLKDEPGAARPSSS